MLSVTLYEFKKRENSTKRPDSTVTQRTHNAVLKMPTSMLRPEITFDFGLKGNPSYYNYAYISDLGNRYYFIRDWTVGDGHLWTAHLEVDVLASWKNSIGNSTQYVTRSSHSFDGNVVDNLYPAKATPNTVLTTSDNPFATDFEQGSYVVGIVNNDPDGVGATHYYVFDQAAFNSLCAYLLGDASWTGIIDISEDLVKALFNPMQYIVSCNWFPIKIPITGKLSSVRVGWWTIPVSGAGIPAKNAYISSGYVFLTVPKHPQAARGNYLNNSPYTKHTLYYPGIGSIALDANVLANYSKIGTLVQIDILANTARLAVLGGSTQDATFLTQTFSQVGIPINLAQMTSGFFQNIGGAVKSVAQTATSVATGNAVGAIMGGIGAIGNGLATAFPDVSVSGLNGSMLGIKQNIILKSEFYSIADEDNEDRGRPYCKKVELSTLPGYQMIADPDLAIAGTSEENRMVKGYLEAGYFYE